MAAAREENVFNAKLAEQAERFDDMVEYMKSVVNSINFESGEEELTLDERNLLAVAYKHVIGIRRTAWRNIVSIEHKEHSCGNFERAEKVRAYRSKIEDELSKICHEILDLIDEKFLVASALPKKESAVQDSLVFFMKMKGDYNRYLAEFKDANEKKVAAENTLSAYKAAQEIALAELPPTNPIRLGLALNFAVFYYEILSSPERACTLAKQAFDEALEELDSLGEESYKETTFIMQLLRDNLSLWTSDMKDDDGSDDTIREIPKQKQQQEKEQ